MGPSWPRPVARTKEPAAAGRQVRAFGSYQPGFDGMRGMGMLYMLAYHSQLPYTKGAFLSLSQFFTVSGFLITAIILDGRDRRGSIDVKAFWARRVRRLAPAALLGLGVAVLFGATIATRSQAERLPGEVLGSATYVVNWVFIATDQSYVDLFASPSPVQHYWSLAIEEQFYLLLPLALFGLFRLGARLRTIAALVAGTIVLSTAWTYYLYESGATIDRLYYGTDTRIAEILAGVLLAIVLHRIGTNWSERTRRILGAIAVPALALTIWGWLTYSFTDPFPWKGGLLAQAVLTALTIVGLIAARGPVPVLYGFTLFVALGRITYGVYIFHWPIYLWLDQQRVGLDGWPLFAVRLAVTLPVAILSYRLIEVPIRDGARLGVSNRVRPFLGPAIAGVLVIASFTTTNAASDPLATLRTDDQSFAVPIATADGVLDIAVIGDPTDGVTGSLVATANGEPNVRAFAGGSLACEGGVTPIDDGRTCARWADEWPELVSAHDPDVVVLYADGWAGDTLADLADDPEAEPSAVATELLEGGLDLLTANDAQVVWATSGADLATALSRSAEPMIQALARLEMQRSDLFHVLGDQLPVPSELSAEAYSSAAADVLLTNAALYQRSDRGDLPRVMVVGDSQARTLGYGLERWAAAEGEAWVWTVAVEGCGLLPDGFVMGFSGEEPISERCRAVRQSWVTQLEAFDPQLVIVLSSAYDLGGRRLPEWPEQLGPGDPEYDAYLMEQYVEAVDILGEQGATVVWMQPPCAELRSGQPGVGASVLDPELLRHLNDDLLPEVAASRPGKVELFDLDSIICPGGRAIEETEDGHQLRFDGVHFSVEGSMWFAEAYGPELLDARREQ